MTDTPIPPPLPHVFDANGHAYLPLRPVPGMITSHLFPAELLALWRTHQAAARLALAAGDFPGWSYAESRAAFFLSLAIEVDPTLSVLRGPNPIAPEGEA